MDAGAEVTIDNLLRALSDVYGESVLVHREYFSDFDGSILKFGDLPKYIQNEVPTLLDMNRENNPPSEVSVSAVLIVKKGGKIIAKFYGRNRLASEREKIILARWYPPYSTVHAEYDAVTNFIEWYLWKEPRKSTRKNYDFELLVIRNGGSTPSRPCPSCRKMLKELIGDVTVYYPIAFDYYGVEEF